jgi:uncharacterized protein RhaS with RHS repeats
MDSSPLTIDGVWKGYPRGAQWTEVLANVSLKVQPGEVVAGARFISQDPTGIQGSGPNLYPYTNDDPVNAIDPMGTSLQPPTPNPNASPGPTTSALAGPDTNTGNNSGNFDAGGHAGGFGPSPATGCSTGPVAKGPNLEGGIGILQASRCRNYKPINELEEQNQQEAKAEEGPSEGRQIGNDVTLACGLGGPTLFVISRAVTNPVKVVGTFCAGFGLGTAISTGLDIE